MDPAMAETVAMSAWPGIRTVEHGPWRHRFANGYTNRANSTTVVSWDGGADPDEGIDWGVSRAVTDGVAPVFQISDRPEFEPIREALCARGMNEFSPTAVMATSAARSMPRSGVSQPIDVVDDAAGAWFDAWWGLTGGSDVGPTVVRDYMARLPGRVLAAAIRHEGGVAAVGLGIEVELGLYICAMHTDDGHRRMGYASAIVSKLALTVDKPVVLAVEADNEAARRAYNGLGFSDITGYRYYR